MSSPEQAFFAGVFLAAILTSNSLRNLDPVSVSGSDIKRLVLNIFVFMDEVKKTVLVFRYPRSRSQPLTGFGVPILRDRGTLWLRRADLHRRPPVYGTGELLLLHRATNPYGLTLKKRLRRCLIGCRRQFRQKIPELCVVAFSNPS